MERFHYKHYNPNGIAPIGVGYSSYVLTDRALSFGAFCIAYLATIGKNGGTWMHPILFIKNEINLKKWITVG